MQHALQKMHFPVTCSMFNRVRQVQKKQPGGNWKQHRVFNLQKHIWCQIIRKAMVRPSIKMKFKQAVYQSVYENCSNAALIFSWLPLPIGKVCSQKQFRPNLSTLLSTSSLKNNHFHGHKVKYSLLLHTQSRFQVLLDYTCKL